MRIYTKTGDKGETSLFGGQRVPKDTLRIEAYGTVDELNSMIGIVLADMPPPEVTRILTEVQATLFVLGADLATPRSVAAGRVRRIGQRDVRTLEKHIDRVETQLTTLRTFILPGGSPAGAQLHLARTICRRAERIVVRVSRSEDIGEKITTFLNRLSDLLFVLARLTNRAAVIPEIRWQSR
jgi:cob(I)alamin adenosyltransferase